MLYAQLNNASRPESIISSTSKQKKLRHRRTGSGSPRTSCSSRTSTAKSACLVDTETQTDIMDMSETDLSPSFGPLCKHSNSYPQRVIVKEMQATNSDDEMLNGNCIQLHFVERDPGILYWQII